MNFDKMQTTKTGPTRSKRVIGCGHSRLTRLYNHTGNLICSNCHRKPSLGWLYRCTQETNGLLPPSDFGGDLPSTSAEPDAQLYTLSTSILEAARQGHYTDEQLTILWKQKIKVRGTIQETRPISRSIPSSVSSSIYSLPTSTTSSTLHSSAADTEDTEDTQLSDLYTQFRTQLSSIPEVHDDLETSFEPKITQTFPCNFKICPRCRPAFKERAWQSIDQVMLSQREVPAIYEWNNRPISNAKLLQGIGPKTKTRKVAYKIKVPKQHIDEAHDFSGPFRRVDTISNLSALASMLPKDTTVTDNPTKKVDWL